MRIGVYSDLVYHRDDGGFSADQAFVRFVAGLPEPVSEVVLFGRVHPEPGAGSYRLPSERVRVVPLPYYPRVTAVPTMLRVAAATRRTVLPELDRLDGVWVFGPHPLPFGFALVARSRGVPVCLGVRQDYPTYIRRRLPGRGWGWAVVAAHVLELGFRALARRMPAVVVGDDLVRRYTGGAPVLSTGFSLIGADDVVPCAHAMDRRWDGELTVLTVGRLAPEKNPLLLADVIAGLRAHDRRWRLVVVGDGPLRAALRARVDELGHSNAVDVLGEVPNGPRLWRLYRESHAFLHVSFTEGVPQVLFEAQAAGLPIVATAVGGVASALDHGARGLLVPPADAAAAVDALRRLADDEGLRHRLVEAAIAAAERETMETQQARVSGFLAEHLRDVTDGRSRPAAAWRRRSPGRPAPRTARRTRA